MALTSPAPAAPYDDIAAGYDQLTAGYNHAGWLAQIERLAITHGLQGRRLLDIGCGTGSSFLPLMHAGYRVVACDLSPEMAARARRRAAGGARVVVADMRELGELGEFDLITCLDDTLNHLTEEDDVVRSFTGMRDHLAPSGVAVFDVNTLSAYRRPSDHVSHTDDRVLAWRGGPATISAPGETAQVAIEVFEHAEGDLWRHSSFRQSHRHYPLERIEALAATAGLRILASYGQRPGAVLEPRADENEHPKALFLATRA